MSTRLVNDVWSSLEGSAIKVTEKSPEIDDGTRETIRFSLLGTPSDRFKTGFPLARLSDPKRIPGAVAEFEANIPKMEADIGIVRAGPIPFTLIVCNPGPDGGVAPETDPMYYWGSRSRCLEDFPADDRPGAVRACVNILDKVPKIESFHCPRGKEMEQLKTRLAKLRLAPPDKEVGQATGRVIGRVQATCLKDVKTEE